MVNLISRMNSMEIVQRGILFDGDFMVKLFWRLSRDNMESDTFTKIS